MLRTLLQRRRAAIRREVFSAPEYSKLRLTWDGYFGLIITTALFILIMQNLESTVTLVLMAIPALLALTYTVFAICIQFKAYGEWGDRVYDQITKKWLPTDYQSSESATAAERKRRSRENQ